MDRRRLIKGFLSLLGGGAVASAAWAKHKIYPGTESIPNVAVSIPSQPNGNTLDTPIFDVEWFGAKGDGVTDDTAAFQAAMNQPYPVRANRNYVISANIAPIAGAHLYGNGVITQQHSGSFTWTIGNRISKYPMFRVRSDKFTMSDLTLVNKFEGLALDAGGDNCTITNVTISNPSRSLGSCITAFNVNRLRVLGGKQEYAGARATWTGSVSAYGTCQGIDFGGCRDVMISNAVQYDNGQNGIFYYAASNVSLIGNYQTLNGQSGIQVGPNPRHSGIVITGNHAYLNCADGIDVNWTGAGTVKLVGSITGCVSNKNGYFYGDTTKPTQDGSGVATMRNVSDYVISGCYATDCAGIGIYCTHASNAVITGNTITNSITAAAGIFFGEGISNVVLSDCVVKTTGTALQLGGDQSVVKFNMHDNQFISSAGGAASLPVNTYQLCNWHHNYYEGSTVVNLWFGTTGEKHVYTGTAGEGIYIGTSFAQFYDLNVSGSTTSNIARISGGSGIKFFGGSIVNNGTGVGLRSENSINISFNTSRIWCNAGTGVVIAGGGNISAHDIDWSGVTAVSSDRPIDYSGRPKLIGTQTYTGHKPSDVPLDQRP